LDLDHFLKICKKWDVTATVIGEVTEGEKLNITWKGELIVDVPPRTVAHEGPVYNRPIAKPEYLKLFTPKTFPGSDENCTAPKREVRSLLIK